jgi:arylsulfatase A-like enzyme
MKPPQLARVEDGLRLTLTKSTSNPMGFRQGAIYVDLPDWSKDDWGFVAVRARTKDNIRFLALVLNLRDKPGKTPAEQNRFLFSGEYLNLIRDGEVHMYLLRTEIIRPSEWKGPWRQLGIAFGPAGEKDDKGKEAPSIDILSVSVIPKLASYARSRTGTSVEPWGEAGRRTLYSHVPGKLEYRVEIPENGRLDVGFGVLRKTTLVRFKISAGEQTANAGRKILHEEVCSGEKPGLQRSIDLSPWAGKTIILALEADADLPGNVAFWGSPTISGRRTTKKPNVVFYVIDGAAADFMSVYGYNRRTTPNLERLAAEGAVFEKAYSNSTWTKSSVPSFMTSLQSSVLGGYLGINDPLPEQVVTMAERMHKTGYITEVLSSNPYCGRASSLDRGVDSVVDSGPGEEEPSSSFLHREFWRFRESYPGEPYWVHFQPTDVHMPWRPVAPFAGLFASVEDRKAYDEMRRKIYGITGGTWDEILKQAGIDPIKYMELVRKFYDESMAHQDYMIGQLVARLKDRGEWENTLFIVAADHGCDAAGVPPLDPRRPDYYPPLLASQSSRVPMIFVWSGKIALGRRFSQPVSLIDMLPTILDLTGLPAPELAQGQSLAPLLLGKPGWTPRPVVFDRFFVEGKYLFGSIEVIDGRWGASLLIDPRPDDMKKPVELLRPAPLLIFDVWEDPQALKSLHEERPDLVEKYSKMLDQIWKEHQALAKKFTRAGNVPLTPEQIETLRSLGYLR